MRNLLSTKVQRQLRLMETLIQNHNWMKLHELAEKLECTERILKSDLNYVLPFQILTSNFLLTES